MGQFLCINIPNSTINTEKNDKIDKIESMENIIEIETGNSYLNSSAYEFFTINIGQPFIIEYCSDNKYSNDILAYYGIYSHMKKCNKSKIIQIYSSIPFMMYYKEEETKNTFKHKIKKINLCKASLAPFNYYLNNYNIYTGNLAINKWNEYLILFNKSI